MSNGYLLRLLSLSKMKRIAAKTISVSFELKSRFHLHIIFGDASGKALLSWDLVLLDLAARAE